MKEIVLYSKINMKDKEFEEFEKTCLSLFRKIQKWQSKKNHD